ncbi:MAG: NAD(P)H-hydrate dehydratase [Herpetosiphonaceae bacterium]|nr:NAD(P)H-hydrate dehydratase [Herpetosiphonaceae bacterium]
MLESPFPLVTAAEMRRLEALSVEQGATWAGLMAQAGQGVADWALTLLDRQVNLSVLVLIGPGNNGGDALVAARHLAEAGAEVTLYVWRRSPDAADWPWHAALDESLHVIWAHDDPTAAQLQHLSHDAGLIIDGLLGVGVSRPLGADIARMIATVNAAPAPKLAIDVPSGLDADTGAIWGAIVQADLTVATGLPKRGHHLYPGAAAVGRLVLAPIQLPSEMEELMSTTELNLETLRALVPARPAESHKDTFGRVMVVAGSYFYPGAAWLAAAAATRSGAGVVTLACPRSIYAGTLAALHEATYLPLPENEAGALSEHAARLVLEKLEKYRALLVGPGLGSEDSTGEFLRSLLSLGTAKRKVRVGFMPTGAHDDDAPRRKTSVGFGMPSGKAAEEPKDTELHAVPPLVLDADGLNLLAKIDGWAEKLREHPTILTPHHGEMARLLGVEKISEDHVQVAADAAAQWGVVVVLKGAHTIIAAPEGNVAIHGVANPALATAGSGDVLAGLLAGLLAQGLAPFDAARLAVGVHGLAGMLLRDELGARGVVAGDLLARLPLAWKTLSEKAGQ